jgi:hypothetical protein
MSKYLITLDTDFVSEEILEYALDIAVDYDIKINLFITGKYKVLEKYNNIEIYPHPNFDSQSSHGNTIESIAKYIESLNVSKLGYRSHKYIESNDINEYMKKQGYIFKSNICTDFSYVHPFKSRCGLLEFPIMFEDGGYLKYHSFNMEDVNRFFQGDTVITILFHPMHIALNSSDFITSRNLKDSITYNQYSELKMSDTENLRKKEGIETFFRELMSKLQKNDCFWFSDLINDYI